MTDIDVLDAARKEYESAKTSYEDATEECYRLREMYWEKNEDVEQTYEPLLRTKDHVFHKEREVNQLKKDLIRKHNRSPDKDREEEISRIMEVEEEYEKAQLAYKDAKEACREATAAYGNVARRYDDLMDDIVNIRETYELAEEKYAEALWKLQRTQANNLWKMI